MNFSKLIEPFRITNGRKFRLKDIDPGDTTGIESRDHAKDLLANGIVKLRELQERLFAQDRWALLVTIQAMDAAGKDSTIEHVMSGVNPQGCMVYSFKAPSHEELDHDFLWRTSRCLPERGRIGIFNRSYYEETLVVRVHPELLESQHLPEKLVTDRIWDERFEDINAFERYLVRNGTAIAKFYLHVSKKEQRRRFLARIAEPEKNWKFSERDVQERQYWKSYMNAYEDAIRHTASKEAPWYVIPADNKWFSRVLVSAAIVDKLERLHLAFPTVDQRRRRALLAAKRELVQEGRSRKKR